MYLCETKLFNTWTALPVNIVFDSGSSGCPINALNDERIILATLSLINTILISSSSGKPD
jgi:hypothetical protein